VTDDGKRAVRLEWTGEALRFRGGGSHPVTPALDLDGDNETAPGPMLALLLAAAGCTGADVVSILQKMRVELSDLRVDVEGMRRSEHPRRYESVHFRYQIAGAGLDPAKAERAVSLSVEKYCSVMHTLAADLAVSYEVDVKGGA
jgi:putative redox protein